MVNKIKLQIQDWISTFSEKLSEAAWFQELRNKWEELDPQSKTNLKFASIGLGLLSIFMIILLSSWAVYDLRKELIEKRTLLNSIQAANDEIRALRDHAPILEKDDKTPWNTYLETIANTAGLDKTVLTIGSEKEGASTENVKELLIEVSLKHVNIKQIARYAFSLENGQRAVKLRNLTIDTKEDPSGYLDATLALSTFTRVKHD